MMQFLEQFGDDQIAIVGCIGALLFCGGFMAISQYIGRIPGANLPKEQKHQAIESFESKKGETAPRDRKIAA